MGIRMGTMRFGRDDRASAVQYHGDARVTQRCLEAVVRLVQSDQPIVKASLLSSNGCHAFLLQLWDEQEIAIKAGFTSGYNGEGLGGLATVLQLMRRHRVEVDEFEVAAALLDRLNSNGLTDGDLAQIDKANALRPTRVHDYVYEAHRYGRSQEASLGLNYPCILPMRVVDSRVIDLALKLDHDADSALMTGYRRLERIVADRCGLTGAAGQKIFATAFQGATPVLSWVGLESAESAGRAQLFTGCYMAFRNRRAHKEFDQSKDQAIREFLLLNELFLLEADAV